MISESKGAMPSLWTIAYLLLNPTVQLTHLPVQERAVSVEQNYARGLCFTCASTRCRFPRPPTTFQTFSDRSASVSKAFFSCIWTSRCQDVFGHLAAKMYLDILLPRCIWTSRCRDVFGHLAVEMSLDILMLRCIWTWRRRDVFGHLDAEMYLDILNAKMWVDILLPRCYWTSWCQDVSGHLGA